MIQERFHDAEKSRKENTMCPFLLRSIERFARLILFVALACSSSGGSGSSSPGPITKLYIAGGAVRAIQIYDSADTVNGNVAPDRSITGAATNIDEPYGIAYHSRSDSIFLGNWSGTNVLIFDGVSGMTGNIAPSRELAGAATGITQAQDVFVDEVNDLLYVSGSHGVAIFSNASTIHGNVSPTRLITGAATLISGGTELRSFVDTVNDRLYVSDPNVFPRQVLVFDNVSTLDGNVAPDRVISGTATTFKFPWAITVDVGRDLLYVGGDRSDGTIVMVLDNASTADGDIAPTRKIQGAADPLGSISGVFLDATHDTIYVTDANGDQVLIWNNASTADGNVTPDRTISGAATGIVYPGSVVGVR